MTALSHVIAGRVCAVDGNPVAGARVYFTAGPVPLPEVATLTDRDGAFSLSAPSAGTYTLECAADRYMTAAITETVGSAPRTTVEIVLREVGT